MNKFLLPLLFLVVLLFAAACEQTTTITKVTYKKIQGPTMGTTYSISFQDSLGLDLEKAITQLLFEINEEVSTYIDTSLISQFNQAEREFLLDADPFTTVFKPTRDHHFRYNFGFSSQIHAYTKGAFDPTVMPLVNYWGFGYSGKKPVTAVDSQAIDSLMAFVGFDKVRYSSDDGQNKLIKYHPGVQLDFSAVAKGYAVDELARLLEKKGVKHYLVEIGGELKSAGLNKHGKIWTVGINTPKEEAGLKDVFYKIPLNNKALATSGNYRNYHKVNGQSYGHTINPRTGFPEKSNLLSASVIAESCILADTYATAFMVMGLEEAYEFALNDKALEAYFIFSNEEGGLEVKATPGMREIPQ